MAKADAFPFPTQSAPLRFVVGLAAVATIFIIDSRSGELIDDESHFLLLGIAVMASAWVAGTGPALAATILGAVLGAWHTPGWVDARATQTHLAIFVVQGLLLTALVAELRRAHRFAEQQANDAVEARRESERAVRMKLEFLATLSHELRTPLNSIMGWLHLLRTGKLDKATEARGLDAVERNVKLQAQLTSDLLDLSKSVTGTLRLESRPVLLAHIATQSVGAAIPAADAKGVRITSTIPEVGPTVLGDPGRLRQITWQLIANALKFTPRGGIVGVTLARRNDAAQLTVYDSGPGISQEFLPRIFDRFTQQDGSLTRAAGGLGIGLSLVKDLVELHGGEIAAENRDREHGAVFTVRLPLYSGETAERVLPPLTPTDLDLRSTPALTGLRILVFEPDADGRELLRTILQQRGAFVRTADSLADALEALEGWRPDVLVSDSATPDHDSYVLVAKVPSLEPYRGGRIPAAALTSFARTDDRVRQMLQSSHLDLPKPVEPAVLAAEIARLASH